MRTPDGLAGLRSVALGFSAVLISLFCAVHILGQGSPGATITGVNEKTGVVSAKVNSTGQEFTFTLANKSQISRLRAGQGVYVNLGNKRVSLDGKNPSGSILAILPLLKKPGGSGSASGANSSSGSASSANSSSSSTTSGSNNPQPVSFSCGGTTNPLTSDTCGRSPGTATNVGAVVCGSSVTIAGTIFPAQYSDWLTFSVPASLANCPTPNLQVAISVQGPITFDLLQSSAGPAFYDTVNSRPTIGAPVDIIGYVDPAPVGTYYIHVYGTSGSAVGTWTITIKGWKRN